MLPMVLKLEPLLLLLLLLMLLKLEQLLIQ